MAAKTTWALVTKRVGTEARVTQYFKGDTSGSHPNFDSALLIADGMMRDALLTRGYTAASWDALTDSTIPEYVRFHLESLLLWVATSSDDARPMTIDQAYKSAMDWLEAVKNGAADISALTEAASVTGSGGTQIRISAPASLVSDRTSTLTTAMIHRDPAI